MKTFLATLLLSLSAVAGYAQTPLQRAQQLVIEAQQLVTALTPTSVVIAVPAGGDVQAAIDSARPGDVVALTPGVTYTGTVILRNRQATGTILITTAGSLPAGRMTAAAAVTLAKLQSGTTAPAIVTEAGAHDYALVGVEVKATAGVYPFGLIAIGANDQTQTSLVQAPSNINVDRCYVHGDPTTGAKRGIELDGANITVTNSTVIDIKGIGQDTQAVAGFNGPGPFLIANNDLEAAGENILFGGADPMIPNLVPADITIVDNYITKPLVWRTQSWLVKNVIELKNAQRVHITRNTIENVWVAGQVGYLLLATVRDQNGRAPWSTISDFEVDHNVLRHGNQGISVLALDDIKNSAGVLNASVRMANGSIHDNLIYDIGGSQFGGGSTHALAVNNGPINLSVVHNTFVGPVSAGLALSIGASKTVATGLVFEHNAFQEGNYGITGDGQTVGTASWLGCVDAASIFTDNLIAKGTSGRSIPYPGTNQNVPVTYDASFTPAPLMVGTDGKPVGADVTALLAAIHGLDLTK